MHLRLVHFLVNNSEISIGISLFHEGVRGSVSVKKLDNTRTLRFWFLFFKIQAEQPHNARHTNLGSHN